jgi:hypothetical protein
MEKKVRKVVGVMGKVAEGAGGSSRHPGWPYDCQYSTLRTTIHPAGRHSICRFRIRSPKYYAINLRGRTIRNVRELGFLLLSKIVFNKYAKRVSNGHNVTQNDPKIGLKSIFFQTLRTWTFC